MYLKIKLIIEKNLKNTYGLKKYRIQEVIKPGQVILIQVLKEERGQKKVLHLLLSYLCRKIYGFNAQYSKRWRNIKKNF